MSPKHTHTKREHFNRLAPTRASWRRKNRYYYAELEGFIKANAHAGTRILEIGCGTGQLLHDLNPARGLGIDFAPEMIRLAQTQFPAQEYPHLEFRVAEAEALELNEVFDYIIISDVIGELVDVWAAFRQLRACCHPGTRIMITYFNHLWEPLLRVGERLGMKVPQFHQNWLSLADIQNLLYLNGFETIRQGYQQLLPKYVPLLSYFCNHILAKLPLLTRLSLVVYLIARPLAQTPAQTPAPAYSVSVIIPTRNERGNIRNAVERTPYMGTDTELVFVDGNSNDGTLEEIERMIAEYPQRKIKLIHQVPPGSEDGRGHGKMLKLGKGDAVRKGFAAASGDILMILDSDLTVPPEDLTKFYWALCENKGEFINGSRLVYPMEKDAMRTLNKIANKFFSMLFTWILEQKITDTLCGTKVLRREDYEKISAGRDYFGDFDPFGDFDLLFGAARQNLKIIEIPVRYQERTYGDIKISRFRHGLLLLKMSYLALRKLK
jgi:ubiquinone/menaquinone biosynthesis C-methylase UbiE